MGRQTSWARRRVSILNAQRLDDNSQGGRREENRRESSRKRKRIKVGDGKSADFGSCEEGDDKIAKTVPSHKMEFEQDLCKSAHNGRDWHRRDGGGRPFQLPRFTAEIAAACDIGLKERYL